MALDFRAKQECARQARQARSKFRRINSLDLIPEDPSQEQSSDEVPPLPTAATTNGDKASQLVQHAPHLPLSKHMRNILLFWPNLAVNLALMLLRIVLYVPLSIAAPSFWLSTFLWVFWKFIRLPIELLKWILDADALYSAYSAQGRAGHTAAPKRTVLLSCGSTIQTLHLARNFFSCGARVVVFEFDGLFGLARFSAAVDKFYVVPRPTAHNVDQYIAALCHIVRKEKVSVYVPVCASSPSYYDALAKPHLELLGCASFITGVQETLILDDCLQFYKRCATQNIALPPHVTLSSADELRQLYDGDFVSQSRNILIAAGTLGLLERYKYILPRQRHDLRFDHEISERQQWLVVRDVPGEHYVTCTTVKGSQVVANVTCRVEHDTKNLVPVVSSAPATAADAAQIERWLKTFFSRVRFQRIINCHISFRLIKCRSSGQLLPLGVRVGVSLPYICHGRSHAQILCRTIRCGHARPLNFLGAASNEETSDTTAFPVPTSALGSLGAHWSSIGSSNATAPLDKREALFAYWDPLPYCAYYHFQLPLESVRAFLQKRHSAPKGLSPRMTIPVH